MKKKLLIVLTTLMILLLTACGGSSGSTATSEVKPETKPEPLNLVGNWEQVDKNNEAWQAGFIDNDQIQIFWVTEGGNSYALYWAGTYEAPQEAGDTYEWTSTNNKSVSQYALLASGDDEKVFKYENGKITYQVSAFGTTTSVSLTKSDIDYASKAFVANSTVEEEEDLPDPDEIAELIDIRYALTDDGNLGVFITNNSDIVVNELEIQALYKNDEGVTISTAKDGHDMVLPGYTVVSRLDAPDEFASVEFEKDVELGVHPYYENHSEEIALNMHDGSNGIILEITNNSAVKIEELEYIVVYYLGDHIVSVSYAQDVRDIDPGKTVTEEISPYNIEYDHYVIYLNQAHTFGL